MVGISGQVEMIPSFFKFSFYQATKSPRYKVNLCDAPVDISVTALVQYFWNWLQFDFFLNFGKKKCKKKNKNGNQRRRFIHHLSPQVGELPPPPSRDTHTHTNPLQFLLLKCKTFSSQLLYLKTTSSSADCRTNSWLLKTFCAGKRRRTKKREYSHLVSKYFFLQN